MSQNSKKKYWPVVLIGVVCVSLLAIYIFISNGKKDKEIIGEPIQKSSFLLNTIITITLYDSQDESIIDGAMELIGEYEKVYSRTLETSEVYKLNHGTLEKAEGEKYSYKISDKTADILKKSLYYSNLSGGKFDVTIEPITSQWNFISENAVIPEKSDLEAALPFVDYKNLILGDNTVTFRKEGMGIDLGAIAKGYIADRVKDYLLDQGVKSAMINLGGNVLAVGKKPGGEAFKVGIQKPFAGRNELVAAMEIEDKSVVSSGIYERYIMKDDNFYHHIIDPSTGYPYKSDLVAVTIVSNESVDGDGLSTTCFALGLEKGMELIESLEDTYAIFITDDYELHYTEGFFDNIKVTEVKE
jgi:thiamine biosynthesis lipoprotein